VRPETPVERALVAAVSARGGLAIKLAPTMRGLPDRLILLPNGEMRLGELKAPGETPRESQMMVHRHLEAMGHPVTTIDTTEGARRWAEKHVTR
jgi:putative nuclease p44